MKKVMTIVSMMLLAVMGLSACTGSKKEAKVADEHFVPSVVEEFCKRVYEDEEHFIFFKPFCNLYYSVYADALLFYQHGRIDYDTFCQEFQELSS